MLYKVAVTETRRRVLAVEANDQSEAHRRVSDGWRNGEVTLDDDDFDGFEVYVVGEASPDEILPRVERKG